MSTATTSQPPQPPKQTAYTQDVNPVSQTPAEQRPGSGTQAQPVYASSSSSSSRQYGDAPPAIHRTADSLPSSDDKVAQLQKKRERERKESLSGAEVDTEYGVEQQPAEGRIAAAVEEKQERAREQAGAHSGPVGSAGGPGAPGFGEEGDFAKNLDKKRENHDRILGQKAGKSPPPPDEVEGQEAAEGTVQERERLRQRKLKEDEELDVKGAVKQGTHDAVVGR
ncbi:hypothetical protein DTO207G8_4988 [Paecilomyces variotii]|nr:hypothetical protein DTO207G8_4988 [Paecilomyces variotii]